MKYKNLYSLVFVLFFLNFINAETIRYKKHNRRCCYEQESATYKQKKNYPLLYLYKDIDTQNCREKRMYDFRGANAFYNHFIIDDRVSPGKTWNEEFTWGIR